MKTRRLGDSPLNVSVLCFGGNVFGWTVDKKRSFELLDAFVEAGGNFIDTANMYGSWVPGNQGGESEMIIGEWMKARKNREKVVVATKVGMEMRGQSGLAKAYILREVEESLVRLQTDYIDLYISHKPDPSTPIEETMEAYALLVKQGKVRVCGASNYSGQELREAIETSIKRDFPRYQSLQPLYNLYDREQFEKELRPVCEEYNLGVTPYYALAAGFLTGKYRKAEDLVGSERGDTVARRYMNERGHRVLAVLDEVAKDCATTPAVVALAWLINQPTVTSAIASATTIDQLRELVKSTEIELGQRGL